MTTNVTPTTYTTTDGYIARFDASALDSTALGKITDPNAAKLDRTQLLALLDPYPQVRLTVSPGNLPAPDNTPYEAPPTDDMEMDVWTLFYRNMNRAINLGGQIRKEKWTEAMHDREERKEKYFQEFEMKMSAARETKTASIANASTKIAGAVVQAGGGVVAVRDIHLSMKSSKEVKGNDEKIETIKTAQEESKTKYEEKSEKLNKAGDKLDRMHADASTRSQDRKTKLEQLEAERAAVKNDRVVRSFGVDRNRLVQQRAELEARRDLAQRQKQWHEGEAEARATGAQELERQLPGDEIRHSQLGDRLRWHVERRDQHANEAHQADVQVIELNRQRDLLVAKPDMTPAERQEVRDQRRSLKTQIDEAAGVSYDKGERARAAERHIGDARQSFEQSGAALNAKKVALQNSKERATHHNNSALKLEAEVESTESARNKIDRELAQDQHLRNRERDIDARIFDVRHAESASVRANELPEIEALQSTNKGAKQSNEESYTKDTDESHKAIADLRKATAEKTNDAHVFNQRSMIWSQFGQAGSQFISSAGETAAAGSTFIATSDSAQADFLHNQAELKSLDYEQNKSIADAWRETQLDSINTLKTVWDAKIEAQKAASHYS